MTLKKNKYIFPCAALALYSVLTLTGALNHELWFDEAQAWCIVRDNDAAGIIRQLRYEGHPALWYFILLPFARLGFSCNVIPLISWAFSAAAAWIVIFKSPLKPYLKAAVLMSGGFLFFNTVISRSYSVIQLLLCVIALVYPERKKRPVLFGTLICLLMNTHVIMCGLIGFFGICMIIELFKDWKSNTARRNAGRIIGLFIAGAGLAALILPILNSVSRNSMVLKPSEFRAETYAEIFLLPRNIMKNSMFSALEGLPVLLVSSTAAILLVLCVFLLRYNRKMLIGALSFTLFMSVTDGLIWRNNTNRACTFIFVLLILYWISLYEEEKKYSYNKEKIDSKLALWGIGIIENNQKYCGYILTILLFSTTPAAAYTLAADIAGDFSPSKAAAEYIKNNYSTDTVLISNDDYFPPQVAAYLPDYTCYISQTGEFLTYDSHVKAECAGFPDAPHFEKACEVRLSDKKGYVFLADKYIPFDVNYQYIGIYPYSSKP